MATSSPRNRRCWTVLASWLLMTGLAQAGWANPGESAHAVEGIDRARIAPPAEAQVSAYSNVGYVLRAQDGEVEVEVVASALESRAAFQTPAKAQRGAVGRLAYGLTAGSSDLYEAVSRVLGWIAANIDYSLNRRQEQSPEAVLKRRSGYCTGVARLAVSMLRSVGVEAREVAGYVALGGRETGGTGYHRWIEVWMPDRGWVFSDPLSSHHYVPATYVRLASEQLSSGFPSSGSLLERADRLTRVDLYPAAPRGVTARRNWMRQYAAAVQVELEGATTGTAVLEGKTQRQVHALVNGRADFLGLEPGAYRLRLIVPEGIIERAVELPGRVRATISLPSTSVRSEEGTVEGAAKR